MQVRVVVYAKPTVVRAGLRTMLDAVPEVVATGAADSLLQVQAMIRATAPHVVVADVSGAAEDPDRVLSHLTEDGPGAPDADRGGPAVILVCTDLGPAVTARLLESGAAGLVAHDADIEEVASAVRSVSLGHTYIAPCLAGGLIEWLRQRGPVSDEGLEGFAAALTPREREVLVALAHGHSPEETAIRLFISVATVRTHIYRLRHKLPARDRAELVSFAYRAGVVSLATAHSVGSFT